jgi:hypothetical protein
MRKLIKDDATKTNSSGTPLYYSIHEIAGAKKPFEVKLPGQYPRRYKNLSSALESFNKGLK